ncbi:MAG: PD40 domain-containing protein, partial [Anaerolineae bacterium]|nr:PD40 domain-containing protein [Anaerolineae bacterium]
MIAGVLLRVTIAAVALSAVIVGLTTGIGRLLPSRGDQLAYVQETQQASERRWRLRLMDTARHLTVTLNPPSESAYDFVWSPDGNSIAYIADVARVTLHILSLDNGRTVAADLEGHVIRGRPVWLPGNNLLAFPAQVDLETFSGTVRELHIALYNPRDHSLCLSDWLAGSANLSWTPDGSSVTFATWIDGLPVLAGIQTQTENPCRTEAYTMRSHPWFSDPPQWSPDRRYLAYSTSGFYADSDSDVYVASMRCERFDTDCIAATTRITETEVIETRPIWSPDGRRLAFISGWTHLMIWDSRDSALLSIPISALQPGI